MTQPATLPLFTMFICRRFIQFVFFFIVLLPSVTGGWIAYSGSLKHIPNINECSTKQLPPAATTTSIGEESKTFVNDSFVRTSVEEHDPPYVQQASAPHERSIFTHESKNGHCGSTVYPMDLVVGYPLIQKALEIAVVTGTSLVIVGPTGTCKSVMARSVPLLFPDPPPTTRVVHVPATAAEDALTGSVDLDKSLETGRPVFQSGLLTRAHGAIVLLDDVNLMDVSTASVLFQALADGSVHVEREGMSVEYPCQPAVTVATYNDDYEELREHFIDRFAMQVSTATAGATASVMDRVKGVLNVEAYADFGSTFCRGGSGEVSPSPRWQQKILQQAAVDEKERRERITEAKKLFPNIQMSRPQLLYVCQQATAWDCEGQRAEFFASLAARAAAALAGRRIVQEDDLEVAVKLCIAPRGRLIVVDVDQEASESPQQQSPDTLPIPPPPDTREMPDQKEQREEDTTEMEEQPDPQDTTNEEEPELTTVPEEFMFGVDTTISVDPHLLVFQKRFMGRGKRAGKRSRSFNVERGRFVKAIFSTGQRRGRLAVGATLRAAAPHQVMRRKRKASVRPNDKRIVIITKDDFRIQQLKKKIGNLVIFVVDASGSMALNRMSAAKGAAMTLLQEAYKSRDKIALIAFHGDSADLVVPPTKALALARSRLEGMPCGSKTPLADALSKAARTGQNAIKVKQDTGKVILVVISDCRPNVPLCVSAGEKFDASVDPQSKDGLPSRAYLQDEVLALARQIGALADFDLLVIDTEDKFIHTGIGKELAQLAGGNYHHLDRADGRSIARVVQGSTS